MVENAEKGLLSYAIHPGGILTNMGSRLPKEVHSLLKDTPEVAAGLNRLLDAGKRDWLAGRYISCTGTWRSFSRRSKRLLKGIS